MPNSFRASGISCQPTLFVDPVLCVAAPMAGARQDHQLLMPFVSHREKYIISPYIDWLSFFFNRSWRKPMDGIASLMIKLADVEQGDVHHGKMRKTLTPLDHQRLQQGVGDCREILMRMGAKADDIFLGTLNAGHPGGMLPLSQAEAATLHSPLLPDNLYVCDAAVRPLAEGGFEVTYTDEAGNVHSVTAKKVVTTCGAYALPSVLPFVKKEEMDKIANLVYAPVIQIGVGLRNVENHHYKAFGALIPSKEKKDVLGILFPSACFAGRASEAGETLAFFIGGVRHPEMLQWTDEQFVALVNDSLYSLLKYPETVTIDEMRIFRHEHAIPQYQESSDDRYAIVEALQQRNPGLGIAGNLRGGIGMADRMKQGAEVGK